MLTVKECADALVCERLAKKFGAEYSSYDRAFVLYDTEPIGMGVVGLDKGVVVIKSVSDCGNFQNFDLLARSVLFFVKDLSSITVRADCNKEYFLRFGFAVCDEKVYINNKQINFVCLGEERK